MSKDTFRNIILLRKPISEPNLALNVEKHSTCALNVKQTRIPDRVSEDYLYDYQVKGQWTRNMVIDQKALDTIKKQIGENVFKVVGSDN